MIALILDPFSPELDRLDRAIEIEEQLAVDPDGSDWSRGLADRNLKELIGKRARLLRDESELPEPPLAKEGSAFRSAVDRYGVLVLIAIVLALAPVFGVSLEDRNLNSGDYGRQVDPHSGKEMRRL